MRVILAQSVMIRSGTRTGAAITSLQPGEGAFDFPAPGVYRRSLRTDRAPALAVVAVRDQQFDAASLQPRTAEHSEQWIPRVFQMRNKILVHAQIARRFGGVSRPGHAAKQRNSNTR